MYLHSLVSNCIHDNFSVEFHLFSFVSLFIFFFLFVFIWLDNSNIKEDSLEIDSEDLVDKYGFPFKTVEAFRDLHKKENNWTEIGKNIVCLVHTLIYCEKIK